MIDDFDLPPFSSTPIRRPFDGISEVIEVTVIM